MNRTDMSDHRTPTEAAHEFAYRPGGLPGGNPDRSSPPTGAPLPTIGIVNVAIPRTWGEWAGDRVQVGLGSALEQLIAGILLGIGQALIEAVGRNLNAAKAAKAAEDNTCKNVEVQAVKIDVLTGNCASVLGENGKVNTFVLEMLGQAQVEEPQNYSAYLSGVIKCVEDHRGLKKES